MATTLSETEAKQILQEQEQRDRLEAETKTAVAQARATLISAETQRKREAMTKEYQALLKRLESVNAQQKDIDGALFIATGAFLSAIQSWLDQSEQKIALSKQADKAAFALGVRPPEGLQFDQHVFRKPFYGLIGRNSLVELYLQKFLDEQTKGELDTSAWFPE